METFLVECYWPNPVKGSALPTRRFTATEPGRGWGGPIEWLGSILVPSDGLILFLFQAPSEADVRAFANVAEMPFDRVVRAIRVGPDG